MFHDNWRYYTRSEKLDQHGTLTGYDVAEYDHYGHTHLFMLTFPWSQGSQDAFSGSQKYSFALRDEWGPRSNDPNQQVQYRVVGTPKWYFHVKELWRRVYIQPWDLEVNTDRDSLRRGVKYDCAQPDKMAGPFREGRDAATRRDFAPAMLKGARTLPLEYFRSDALSQQNRDNYVASQTLELCTDWATTRANERLAEDFPDGHTPAQFTVVYQEELDKIYSPETYDLQHGHYLFTGGDAPFGSDSLVAHPAAVPPFGDALYIWPIIEYQAVTQLDWERLPGYEQKNDIDNDNFGDGWEIEVEVPFVSPATGQYQSPFGPTPGIVRPPGQYFGEKTTGEPLVPLPNRMRTKAYKYGDVAETADYESVGTYDPDKSVPGYNYDHPFKMPPEIMNDYVSFHDPYNDTSGRWVQQCLGGIVQARAVVTIESKVGGREDIWVNTVQYLPATPFAGNDQAQGVAT